MKTFSRICIKDFKQDDMELKRGEKYITTEIREDGSVVVFTEVWFCVLADYFAGEEVFTE